MSPLLSRIQSNTQLYQRLRKELSEESSILVEIEDASTRRGLLTEKLNNLQTEVDTLTKQSKKEYSALHKARHFSVRSAAATLTGKKKALIAKEEAEYQEAFDKEQRARRELEIIKTDFNKTTDKKNQLQHKADHLKNIRQQLNNLLDEVFYEPDSTEIRENQLRAELQNYIEQHALAKNDSQRFLDTNYNLVQALRSIAKAKELIHLTLNFVSYDLFGSSIIDDQQIMYVQGCQQSIWEVQRRLNVARQVLPEIPYPASLDVVTNNHMLSLRFDGGYVDTVWQSKTQQGYNLLVSVEPSIKNALQWVKDYLRYTNGAIDKLTETKESTYNRLLDERMRIFDRVISGNQRSSMYENGSTSDNNNNMDMQSPPPVYTAPARTNTQTLSLPEINSPPPTDIYNNIDTKHGANSNTNDLNSNHLLNVSSSSSSSPHHLRTASQSSSIVGSPPTQPPPQPAPPPTNPFMNNNHFQNGPPLSPTTSNFYNNNNNNNGMQSNPPLSPSSQPYPFNNNNNNNNNGMQGNPPLSPSSQFYNNNGIQGGSPSSPSSHSITQKPNLKHSPELSSNNINSLQNHRSSVPSSSSSNHHLQNQPLSSSLTALNNSNNNNNVQGQQQHHYTSHNENNPFRDTKHLVSEG